MKLDVQNVRVVELKAWVSKLKKRLEQAVQKGPVIMLRYSLLYGKSTTLEERVSKYILIYDQIAQRILNISSCVMALVDGLNDDVLMLWSKLQANCCFLLLRLQKLIVLEVSAVFTIMEELGWDTSVELCGTILECQAATNEQLHRQEGVKVSSPEEMAWSKSLRSKQLKPVC